MEKFKQKLSSVKGTILKYKKITLIIAIVLVIVGVVSTLIYKNVEYARMLANNPELAKAMTYEEVKDGDENIEGTDNVKFDAFFLRDLNGDGYAESIRGTSKEIGKEDTLYMELNVQTAGYLKDAKITINDGNFYFQTTLPKDDELKDNYIGNDVRTIEFNQLANGTQKMITGIVRSGDYSYSSRKDAAIGNNINNYSKVNSVTLTGTYVGEDGTETPITKTVNFNIDWYGTTKATIYTNSSYNNYSDLDTRIDEENGTITLDFSVRTEETQEELILKKNHVEATIPQLNGYDPLTVEYTGSNATANYNEETKVLTIDREAQVGEDGTVTSGLSDNNSYSVKVTYPLEAYQSLGEEAVTIKIPIQTYYEGYNNPSEEFDNPYKSNTATATITASYKNPTPVVTSSGFDVTVGKYITTPNYRYVVSKQKPLSIYNGLSDKEEDDIYQVRWEVYTGTNGESSGIVMKETKDGEAQGVDKFIKTDSSKESMENVTTNVGIAFSGADSLLKEDGWIKVYDEDTGDLLVTFTKDNWNNYSSSNPYKYELPVKHIRVETSATNASQRMYVYNIKELDDEYITTNYTREEFDNLQYIESTLVGYMNGEYAGTDSHRANYEAPYSIADIGISNNTISTQSTEKNEKLTITARYNSLANQVGWVDGSFLVKLPEEIIDAQINDVQINNSAVSITSYELVEQNGVKLIKINTKNNNDTPQTYSITVDVDITPDPRVATVTKNIELYATNEEASDYYYNANDTYDVNDNLNTEEKVNYDTASLSMVSPNSLLTNQVGSNYDDKGSQVVSPEVADIKPVYGIVDQESEEKEATIGVQVRNNYGSTISDIQILGKIPFEGNTYVISGGDLGSTFTTKMKDTGIIVPEELQQYATVYYSENENPDRDLSKAENGWKTAEEVTNWDNVKTFLIDLGNYIMPTGAEYVFNYTVKIPNGLEFNQVSFSHHGVYFSLDTDQGKYRTQTEPNRLGFRIAEKFNLELTKYQTGKDKVIPGATYSITDEETGESKTAVTTANGTLTINNLYAEKAYTIQEIKTPSDYELNSDVIRFIGHVDNEGNLTIEKTQGTTKEDIQVIKEEGQDYKVSVKVEDEVKASIKIHKTEQGTDTNIQNVRYKLTGYNLPENGRTVTTNSNGEATISGLSINQEYTLTETKAEGYYLANPIKFKIVNNDGNYTIETTEGTIKGQATTEEDSIPTITLNIEDEKIPTYSLQIIKVKKTTESTVSDDELKAKAETALADTEVTYLEGAKFKLYKNDEVIGEYTTDGSGKVTIDNLYQYIDGKDEEATYTLKEVLAPEGYAKVKDITFKVENKDGTLQLVNTSGEEENYTVEGTTVKLTIEDSPSFRLIKKDKETQQPIANVKFAIYNVDDGEVPATNSKGEIIGTKETINGREYYTVQTDENGELTADLTEGLYKAIEVQAPEQYDLTNQTYYFGIGASREAPEGLVPIWANSISGLDSSMVKTIDGGYIVGLDKSIKKYNSQGYLEWEKTIIGTDIFSINSVAETTDGGYIVGGYYYGSIQIENYSLKGHGSLEDSFIVKFSQNGTIEWVKQVGGNFHDNISCVSGTSDGGIVAVGTFSSNPLYIDDKTITGSGWYGLIIKYSSVDGTLEWVKQIDSDGGGDGVSSVFSTKNGEIFIIGTINGTLQIGNQTLTSENGQTKFIAKYNKEGEVEFAKTIAGNYSTILSTNDGGYIVGGTFSNSIQVENQILTSKGATDGLIIKYNSEGEVEWANNIGGSSNDYIESVAATSDGGCIAGGYFSSEEIQVGNEKLSNNSAMYSGDRYCDDGLIIKYSRTGEVEWAKNIGGSKNDRIYSIAVADDGGIVIAENLTTTIEVESEKLDGNLLAKYKYQELANPVVTNAKSFGASSNDQINSVDATSDGGYIAGGYFYGTIQLENGVTLKSNGAKDGLIIKYNKNKQVEWVKNIGGSSDDNIQSIVATSDGGYIAGGYFYGTIQVGDDTFTNSSNGDYGLIIKYNSKGRVEWTNVISGWSNVSFQISINSVEATSDGGAIIGGKFDSITLNIGNKSLHTINVDDGFVAKYSSSGEAEWANVIGGSDSDYINSVAPTSDGGAIAGGYFYSSDIQVGNETLTNNSSSTYYPDGLIIKYSNEGVVEWAKNVGGSNADVIESVAPTSDGGYIAGGYFGSSSIQVENETLTSNGSSDGLIIKYSSEGEVEWAKGIGGSSADYIQSVAETSDGGYIVGGYFQSSSIQIGNETLTNNSSSTSYSDGLIIKYNSEGEVEWAKSIGGSNTDQINSVASTSDGRVIAGGYFSSSTIEVDGHTLENQGDSDGMILEVVNQVGVPEVQELTVENSRKEFKITTDVKEIDGVKGGSISGEGMNPYEKVKYGENSTKQIVMTPDENYEIIGITVNGEEWPFEENPDGTYTMPTFENMTEDKHVEVTYSLKDNKIIINKVDSKDNSKKLSGATFKLDQIEERTNPENVVGEIVANGAEYAEADLDKGEVSGVLGDLTNNGTYYFVENSDGTLAPTNSKTYQTANEGSVGIQNSTANSYIPINLSDKEGKYVVVVNAKISSESADYGYATVNTSTTAPSYSTSSGRFMYISGTVDSKDYTSTTVLQGGQTYYLHLGYRKDSSVDTNDDQVVINSIKVYEANSTTYNFVDNGSGGYESNNQGQDSTVANSYIPIDLTNYTGKYNLIVNANVSSQSGDYGYATINTSTTAPSYSSSTGRFIYISGTTDTVTTPTDYTTVLQGGQKYYLHLGYYKNSSTSSGEDKFTVNSIKITLNDSELYHTEVTTNNEGQGVTQIPFGKYQITEVTAPEGYELNSEPIVVEFRADGNHEFTIENKQAAKVIVHHYLKDNNGSYTTTKVAEDELVEGKNGEKYTTNPKLDLSEYELEKDGEGNYVLPENATGVFAPGVTEVIYYYEQKEIPLTVHHYIEGTTEKVPLKDGGVAEDVTDSGKEGENYQTSAIEDDKLSDDYEIVETPSNSTGTYSGEEVVVTYYYKKVERKVVINKYDEDGKTPLAGVKFAIKSKDNYDKLEQIANVGELEQNGNYYFVESNGKYISNNQQKNSTTANSYIKIDLTSKEDVTLKINAEISSEGSYDYGYATITENETAPSYSSSTGRIFRISGKVSAKDYETTLEGGKVYYLHLGYRKDGSGNSYDDTFTINSITINDVYILGGGQLYTTNEKGQIEVTLKSGDYIAKETSVPENYQLPEENTTEFSVTKQDDIINLDITNTKKKGTVITHYYIEGSEDKVPNSEGGVVEDITNEGNVGDNYATKEAENVAPNYEFVRTEGETSGQIVEGTTEIIYYYKLKDPVITESAITKESSIEKVTNVNQEIDYTVNYKTKIDAYIGEAEVTIVDYLPYEIDEEKSNIDGGTYNAEEKTITWTEKIGDIDTFVNGAKEIEITKEITIVYKDIDVTQDTVSNRVTGKVKLNTPEKEETVEGKKEIPTQYLVNIPVTKVWQDNNNEAQKRPDGIIAVVKNGTEEVQRQELNNGNNWTYTFTGLNKYDNLGNEINYTIEEKEKESKDLYFYQNEVEGNTTNGFTITNTFKVPDEKVSVNVNKVWEDNDIQSARRPDVVTINVIGENNKVVQSYDLKVKEGETSHTFTELPKYNSLGNAINYTVEEQEKNIDDLKFYTNSVSGDMNSGYTITNTFTRPEDTVDIIANKVWNDNEEQSSRRPESIILVVKNGEQEVESKEVSNSNLVAGTTNKWSVEFEGLQKYDENGQEIKYTIEEKEKNSGDLHFYQAEENNVAVEDNQATIRNYFVRPEDVVSVTVTKNWNDSDNVNGRRPTSIKLQVKNGENVVSEQEVSAKNNWTYTFTDLPKYDDNGKEIEYTVAEAEVNSGDLKFYTNDSVSGDIISGYTITNTFKVPDEKVSLTVNKVWKDNAVQSLRRPEVITINVLGESGVVQSYDLNVASETSHTFTDLPKYNSNGKEISYTVEEQEKNIGDLKFYTGVVENVESTSENNKEVTITNTFKVPDEKTNVVVTKVWEDNNDKANKRPTSIKLLLKNGTKTLREQEISSNDAEEGNTNTWSYEFTDLDKYNSNGQEIVYTADEAEINSGDLQFYNKKVSGTTITNTFTQDTTKVEVTVNKVWVDTEAQEARRPESVVIVLKANGEEINRAEVSGENQEDKDNWSYTFKDLPKYDEFNNIINYTVDEAEANKGDLKFYSKAIDGTTITNTFTRPTETISIEVNKKWEDQENRYEKRPVSIKYQVKNGEEVVAEKIVTNKDNWEYTFEGLDKYNEEGQEITYTVDEQEVISGDLYYYEKTAGEVTDKAGSVNVKEATVTNTMVKIPSTVVVKYVDKNTGEEISEAKEKEGIIGEEFDVTEDVKEIPGYTLVEEPEEKKGTYTSEVQEKIYYYAKNTKVIVKYLEKDETEEDSDNKVLSEQIEMSGYEGEGYATNSKQIEGYTLVATKGNLSGTMTREEQVVVYYYAKNTKVIVKYLEKDDTPTDTSDNKVLLPENTIEGYVGKEYKTTEEVIPGYTLVQKTTNYEGVMTEDVIEVVYYYAKNTSVVVKYLEQDDTPDNNDDNTVLAEEIVISGYEGKSYETEKKDIENYTFVEDTENTSGKMTKEQIEVIYYYAQNTKAKVQHIDRETGKILKEETTNGKVGDLFKTHAEDFEGYVLVESPEEPNIIMDKTGTQIVKYYYAHVSAGIIEKHIDEITGELLYSEEHKGNEGDPYNIPSKEFAGYDLVTDKLPENSEGTMLRDEVIEVKYYYIKKATVVVKYVDENTGEEIAKEETIEGHENDSYETQEKQIDDYNLVKTPENASGTMVITKNEDGTYNTEIEVIYYYKKIAGGVKENHIDINTGKKLYTEEHKGNVGDKYEIPSREFEGYDLVTERLPDNSKGTMTEKEIEVNYYYEKQAKVKVEYIDKQTGEKLDEEEIKGHVGDSYETEEKEFDGYDLVEKPSNDKGEMKEEETVVKYYYARKAEVEVKYLEKGTDYEVAEGSTLNGYVGDKYETEQKEIPYYKFIEKTENWKGNMSQEKITVIYYYEKEIFNLGVDKWVSNVNINGIGGAAQNIGNKDEIYKVDIYRKDANTANVKVTYKIRITNKGEIEGTVGRLTDIIPSGYSYNQEDNEIYFENNSGVLTTDALKDEVIQPGEYKEIEVVLRWTGGEGNFGQKDNMVILTQLNNPAGYEDIDKDDNTDTSSMIITVATGLDRNDRIAIIGIVQIVLVITIGLLLSYKKKEKHQDK